MNDHENRATGRPPRPIRRHRFTTRLMHPLSHVVSLVSLHVIALAVIEKTPLLTFLH